MCVIIEILCNCYPVWLQISPEQVNNVELLKACIVADEGIKLRVSGWDFTESRITIDKKLPSISFNLTDP